eukprot:maker-scaffold82_size396747-snap-gene-1.16 protein:Tk06819 transcript:maker-scaffold82_size396747-snap-gene-1.16-mRNA-1 annotation:"hypothetical protein DAPPUDRAFT_308081"
MVLCRVYWVLVFLVCQVPYILAGYGGHDLFTSLAQLEVLWKNDQEIVKQIADVLDVNQNLTQPLKKYIEEHKKLHLDEEPNYNFLGHPLNAYYLVRHVAMEFLIEREDEKLVNQDDIEGAAFGIVRLYSLYRFNLSQFVESGVISTTLDNGNVVLSSPSVRRISSYDLARMGSEASANGLYDSAADMLELATNMAKKEVEEDVDLSYLLDYTPNVHDHFLDTRGQKSASHRTHQKPFDTKLRKKKKFKKEFKLEDEILGRQKLDYYLSESEKQSEMAQKFNFISEVHKDDLCRGKQLRTDAEMSQLYCLYAHGDSAWLRLGPIKMEYNSFDPNHVTLRGILFDHECDDITQYLGPKLDFPPGRMNHKSKKNDWTMKNCWPDEAEHAGFEKLNRRIEHLSGLHADSSKGHSEGFMCGNYGIGGHYFIHPDFHQYRASDYIPHSTGNRVSTILTVLQAPEAGGATVWPNAGITVFPEKGSAIWWYNIRPSSIPDQYTRHSACPVLLGQKIGH